MPITQIKEIYRKHRSRVPLAAFFAGFLFDMIMLRRIDELAVIIQQALYIAISATLIGVELVELDRHVSAPRGLVKAWKYREHFLHFLLGTLLNSYTIFYFKSASAASSFLFLALLAGLLYVNEFKRFASWQTHVHVALLSLCVISYLLALSPIVLGFIGTVPFLCSLLLSGIFYYAYQRALKRHRVDPIHLAVSYAAPQILFVLLYFLHAIPPVPLSVKYMGIFHSVKKSNGEWELAYTRSRWKFWQNGDQTFYARAGDEIFCFAQVFSPGGFHDRLQVRWSYWDERRGWLPADAIALQVTGGREEGYRAVTKKSNFQPGSWRVQIETMGNREIGRIGFEVVADNSTAERNSHITVR